MPHSYLSLSPTGFETLATDILSAAYSVVFERCGEGPDGGIDCKHITADGDVWVSHEKRYKNIAALSQARPRKQQKVQVLKVPSKWCFLVTACSLTAFNKDTILQAMQPFIRATADIYGADELDALLAQHLQTQTPSV